MDALLAWAHASAWAIYVGGAITMDVILRYAQKTMPPSQVAVVCKNAGGRYRWIALGSLLVIGTTGAAMVLRLSEADLAGRPGDPVLSLSDAYGRTLLLLSAGWLALFAIVVAMAFWMHPAQARRSRPDMTPEEIQAERRRVGLSIARMNRLLKAELYLSIAMVAVGVSLQQGGLF
jgi:uncharacterized membrane protein